MNAPGSTTTQECIDAPRPKQVSDEGPCKGPTHVYTSLSGATTHVRCEGHRAAYEARLAPVIEDINRRYPKDPPADFDPLYAGESWDEPD